MLTRSSRSSMGWHVHLGQQWMLHALANSFPLASTKCFQERPGGGAGGETGHRVAQVDVLRLPRALGPDLQGVPKTTGPRNLPPTLNEEPDTEQQTRPVYCWGQSSSAQGPPAEEQALEGYWQLGVGQGGRGPARDQRPTLNTEWQQRTAGDSGACGGLDWRTETKQPDHQLAFHGLHLNSLLISGHRHYLCRRRLVVENLPTNPGDERPGFNP